MYYSQSFLKGVKKGIIQGTAKRVLEGDARSLDYRSYNIGTRSRQRTI